MALPFKEDEDFRKHNQDALAAAAEDLGTAIADIERLEAEKKDIARDQSDIFKVLKSKGFNVKAVRALIKERKRDRGDLEEERQIIEQYRLMLE